MDLMPGSVTNISSLDDFSGSGNYSIVDEFPYWRLAMAVRVVTVVFIYFPIAVFLNGSVLLAFILTKKLHRPINLMHIALIIELFLVKYLGIFCGLLSFPNGVRFCICWDLVNELYLTLTCRICWCGPDMSLCHPTADHPRQEEARELEGCHCTGSDVYPLQLAVGCRIVRWQPTPKYTSSLCFSMPWHFWIHVQQLLLLSNRTRRRGPFAVCGRDLFHPSLELLHF